MRTNSAADRSFLTLRVFSVTLWMVLFSLSIFSVIASATEPKGTLAISVDAITSATTGPTSEDEVPFFVDFNTEVVNFDDVSDLVITHTGTANAGATIAGGPASYTVTVTGITGDGSFTLAVSTESDVGDGGGTFVSSSVTSEAVTIDNTPPTPVIGAPSADLTRSGPVTYTITYTDAASVNLQVDDVTLNMTGTATGTLAVSDGMTATPTVTLSSISGDGTLGIRIGAETADDTADLLAEAAGPSATFQVDNTAPVITVNLPDQTTVEAGSTWSEPGASVVDAGDGSVAVVIGGDTVNPNAAVGTLFTVTYNATDAAGNSAMAVSRTVTVVDTTAPVITVIDEDLATVEAGGLWTEPGATAIDNIDGALEVSVGGDTVDPSAAVGTVFTITYDAQDRVGNRAAQATRTVTVVDTTAPVITVNDAAVTSVEAGGTWTEPGATATDTVDGAISVTVGGDTVDPGAAVGTTFTVTYNAVDMAGNDATQTTRTVTVVDTTPPTITITDNTDDTNSIDCTVATFVDPGANAQDTVDGMVAVSATGTVEAGTPGTYMITYTATDRAGNSATAIRTVTVFNNCPGEGEGEG